MFIEWYWLELVTSESGRKKEEGELSAWATGKQSKHPVGWLWDYLWNSQVGQIALLLLNIL